MTQEHAFMVALAEQRAELAADVRRAKTEDDIAEALERLADLAELEEGVRDQPNMSL